MTTEEEENTEQLVASQQDDSGFNCIICQSEWTIGGEHRICCLKCGHLFGRNCIEQWIKEKQSDAKCPTCMKPAKKIDIRNLWCKKIAATDNSDYEQILKTLEAERHLRKGDSATIFRQNLQLEVFHEENEKLKKILREKEEQNKRLRSVINQFRARTAAGAKTEIDGLDDVMIVEPESECPEIPEVQPTELKGKFHSVDKLDSCPSGSCKAFAICPTALVMLIAQNTPRELQQNIFAPYGLKKYSSLDTSIKSFIPLHTKPINSIQLKPFGDLILTAGQDRKVRLTSISNNTCIQSYNCDNEPTCVSWSLHRDQQFYVSSGNCFVTLYDIRNTSEYIYQTTERVARTRLISMVSTASDGLNGLIVNDMRGSQFMEISEESNYDSDTIDRSLEHLKGFSLPFEGLMGSVDYSKQHNLALVSTRKTSINPSCTHNLIRIEKTQSEDGTSQIKTKPIKTFSGGSLNDAQPLMSQSRILRHPTLPDHVLVGATDQASRGVKLWDSSDNRVYQTIKTDKFIRDMVMFTPENSNQHVLYLLGETGLNIYRWDYA